MGHLSYSDSKKRALKIILVLAAITFVEVLIALVAKGHIGGMTPWPVWIVALIMIGGSLVKAYLVVFEFMHMKYEMPSLVKTVLLPTLLLVWGIIAFFQEGSAWRASRNLIEDKNKQEINESKEPSGSLYTLPENDINKM